MSYDIEALDENDEVIIFKEKHRLTGGTYEVGGTDKAWLNITYNYAEIFSQHIMSKGRHMSESGNIPNREGINSLHKELVRDTLKELAVAIAVLGNDTTDDYWEPTEGNAKAALKNLLHLAVEVIAVCPDATWRIS